MEKSKKFVVIFLSAIFILAILPERIYILRDNHVNFAWTALYLITFIIFVILVLFYFKNITESRYIYRLHKKNDFETCPTIVQHPDKKLLIGILCLLLILIVFLLRFVIVNSFTNPVLTIFIWRLFFLGVMIGIFDNILLVYTVFANDYFIYKGQKRSYQEITSYQTRRSSFAKNKQLVLYLKGDKEEDKEIKFTNSLFYNFDLDLIKNKLKQHNI